MRPAARRPAALVAALVVALLGPLATLAACGRGAPAHGNLWETSAIHQASRRGELVVLMEAQFKPFTFKEDGVLKGFDVDLGRLLADEMGVKVRFEEREFGVLPAELLAGKGDLIISGITATPHRALELSFSDPYFLTRTIALLSVPRADGVRTLADLDAPGRRIVAQASSTGEYAVKRLLPKAELLTFPSDAQCALEVAQGKADAFVYDEWQIVEFARQHPGTTRVLEAQLSTEPYAIECRKGDPDTLDWLNLVLRLIRLDGRLAGLYAKWFPGRAVPAEFAPPR